MVVVVLAAVVAIATATEVRRVAQVHPQTDHEEDPEGVMSFHLRRRLNLVAGKDVRYGVGGGETMTSEVVVTRSRIFTMPLVGMVEMVGETCRPLALIFLV